MGWSTKYKGPQIDEALEKGRNLRVVNNGWIHLESSPNSPVNLGDLKNPGNYTVVYWTDGPDMGSNVIAPLNITITSINGDLYQFVTAAGMAYGRFQKSSETLYGNWSIDNSSSAINPGPMPPSNPTNGTTIWLDTSDAAAPILKMYSNNDWIEILPYHAMQSTIYDTKGRKTDIFDYIDAAIASTDSEAITIDFNSHITDNVVHVTADEKAKWNNSASKSDVTTAMNNLKPFIENQINIITSEGFSEIEALTEIGTNLQSSINEHIEDESIHPSMEKQAEWNSKAESSHTHNLDGAVTVDPAHIRGIIPSKLLPYDVKERVYEVNNTEEMYALQKNPIHNGDAICVKSDNGDEWYFVINDEYLGTENASLAFKKFSSAETSNVSWEDISGTPNTLSGYGIIDAVSELELRDIEAQIIELQESIPDVIDLENSAAAQTSYNAANDNLLMLDTALSALESAIAKLEYITT